MGFWDLAWRIGRVVLVVAALSFMSHSYMNGIKPVSDKAVTTDELMMAVQSMASIFAIVLSVAVILLFVRVFQADKESRELHELQRETRKACTDAELQLDKSVQRAELVAERLEAQKEGFGLAHQAELQRLQTEAQLEVQRTISDANKLFSDKAADAGAVAETVRNQLSEVRGMSQAVLRETADLRDSLASLEARLNALGANGETASASPDSVPASDPGMPSAVEEDLGYAMRTAGISESEIVIRRAQNLTRTGRAEAAITLLMGLLDKEPNNSQAWRAIARAYAFARDWPNVITAVERIRTLGPVDGYLTLQLACAQIMLAHPQDAIATTTSWLDGHPEDGRCYERRALALILSGEVSRAMADLERAGRDPDARQARIRLADLLLAFGDPAAALSMYQSAARLFLFGRGAALGEAKYHMLSGNLQEARRLVEDAGDRGVVSPFMYDLTRSVITVLEGGALTLPLMPQQNRMNLGGLWEAVGHYFFLRKISGTDAVAADGIFQLQNHLVRAYDLERYPQLLMVEV